MSRPELPAGANGPQTARSSRGNMREPGSRSPSGALHVGRRHVRLCSLTCEKKPPAGIGHTFGPAAQAATVRGRVFGRCRGHGHIADRIWAQQAVWRTACYRGRDGIRHPPDATTNATARAQRGARVPARPPRTRLAVPNMPVPVSPDNRLTAPAESCAGHPAPRGTRPR